MEAQTLRVLRAIHGVSQSELARRLAVSQMAVSHWESDRRRIPVGREAAIVEALQEARGDRRLRKKELLAR